MQVVFGCKQWSSGHQQGFRVYSRSIRDLTAMLTLPSSDGRWSGLGDFYAQLEAGLQPAAYTRAVVLSDGTRFQPATLTIATLPPRSVQGYITAPQGSWVHQFVVTRLGEDLDVEYTPGPERDLILLPSTGASVEDDLRASDQSAEAQVSRYLRRRRFSPPPDAKERGLFFEILEYRDRTSQLGNAWQVTHRYPAIDSNIPILLANNVSCDIDVAGPSGEVLCVEVKSITGAPGGPFQMSAREWNSRIWCVAQQIPYEIVVYYHVSFKIIERRVIPAGQQLRVEPSGFYCFPS